MHKVKIKRETAGGKMRALDGLNVVITGGTGSLGVALVTRLLSGKSGKPKSVTVFSRDELKQANMRTSFNDDRLNFVIGDVRDYYAVSSALSNADILFNAAAMKRVEVCEKFPDEAMSTNYIGASNIVRAIREQRIPIRVVVNVGSDKGAHPMNVYGASKFLQECRLLVANYECRNTRFVGVRYGNVMGSRGSVLPIWQEQIKKGLPLTVTDPDMTRFLINLEQAVDTLISAVEYARPGEIYIPKLLAARIGDMAEVLANSHHRVEVVGKGQGEKMHEVLITCEEAPFVIEDNGYYVITRSKPMKSVMQDEYVSSQHVVGRQELYEQFARQGLIEAGVRA